MAFRTIIALSALFSLVHSNTTQVYREPWLIPIVFDQEGNIGFGDPFEQEETMQWPLSIGSSQALDVESLPSDMDMFSVSDMDMLSVYGDIGPQSISDIVVEPLSDDENIEPNLNNQSSANATMGSVEQQPNIRIPVEQQPTSTVALNFSDKETRNSDKQKTNRCVHWSCSSACDAHRNESLCGWYMDSNEIVSHSNVTSVTLEHTNEQRSDIRCNPNSTKCRTMKRQVPSQTYEKRFQCDVCDKRFRRADSCRAHRRTHTGEKPFQCDICDKRFSLAGNCRSHRRMHTGEKPFQCDLCDKWFHRVANYQIHRRTHTGEKPFQCDICQRRFSSAYTYQIHRRTHTGEKPFECNVCGMQFSDPSNCRRHKQLHIDSSPSNVIYAMNNSTSVNASK